MTDLDGTTTPLVGFIVTYAPAAHAFVYAAGREDCKRRLRERLFERGIGHGDPDRWTITPATPVPEYPMVYLIDSGAS